MNIKDLKDIFSNEIELNNVNVNILEKDFSSSLRSFFLIVSGLFEIFLILPLITYFLIGNPIIIIISFILSVISYTFIIGILKMPFTPYLFMNFQKNKLKKLNFNEGSRIFNLLTEKEYSNIKINKITNYYNSLTDLQKDYFVNHKYINNYFLNKTIEYIEQNNIEEIQKNKEEVTQLVFDNFNEDNINHILKKLKDKIENNKSQKEEFFNILSNKKQLIKEI